MLCGDIVPVVLVKNDEYWLPYALEATRGWFDRYVIYDIGSEDRTRDIIDWFVKDNPVEYFIRKMPHCPPEVQGAFRNSMISETKSDYYFILDGDEIYNDDGLVELAKQSYDFAYRTEKSFGVVKRVEVSESLQYRYDKLRTHHRLYHRSIIFDGPHPGEFIEGTLDPKKSLEYQMPEVKCYHMHNAQRSSLDGDVPKRLERRGRSTYHPGSLVDFDLLEEVPLLREPIAGFPVSPALAKLQSQWKREKSGREV